jgi:ubiquinone/menaquinone biosynthesis C-methylase UbiE
LSLLKSSDQSSKELFEKWSDFYDRSGFINNYLDKWDNELIGLSPATPILDIGCGPGRLVNKLIRAGYRDVYGIDVTLKGPQIAWEKARQYSSEEFLHLTEGLAEYLPFGDRSFASVTLSGVLHHIEKPDVVLREARRVLADAGTLIIADPYFPPIMRQLINFVLDIYPIAGDRRFYTENKVSRIANRAGFEKKKMIKMPLAYILVFGKI